MRRPATSLSGALTLAVVLLATGACAANGTPAASTSASPVRSTSVPADTPSAVTATAPSSQPVAAGTVECLLITRSEAAAVLGSDPGPGYLDVTPIPGGQVRVCRYGPLDNGKLVSFVAIGLTKVDSPAAAAGELAKQRSFYQRVMVDGAVTDVNGAFLVSDVVMNNNATIFFVRGLAVVKITVTLAGAAAPPEQAVIGLAAQVTADRVAQATGR
jgi:hypothetical protein